MVYLFGAGGHAKVVAEIIEMSGDTIAAIFDLNPAARLRAFNTEVFPGSMKEDDSLFVSIGRNDHREKMVLHCSKILPDVYFINAIHPRSLVSASALMGCGVCVMGGAVVNAEAQIGNHVIVNTGATIDHDCLIEDFCHIAPGAALCGNVHVEKGAFVGAGSVVIPGVKVGKGSLVGAGSVVIHDLPAGVTAVGTPARIIRIAP